MEEEWMRDRALLRALRQKTPDASPQELAQAIKRSVMLSSKNGVSGCEKVILKIKGSCVLAREHIMRPTSAGMLA